MAWCAPSAGDPCIIVCFATDIQGSNLLHLPHVPPGNYPVAQFRAQFGGPWACPSQCAGCTSPPYGKPPYEEPPYEEPPPEEPPDDDFSFDRGGLESIREYFYEREESEPEPPGEPFPPFAIPYEPVEPPVQTFEPIPGHIFLSQVDADGPLAGMTLGQAGLVMQQDTGHILLHADPDFNPFGGEELVDDIEKLAESIKSECEDKLKDCLQKIEQDGIEDELAKANRKAACEQEYKICMRIVHALQHVAERVYRVPSDRKRAAEVYVQFVNCLMRALQITDPRQRQQAIDECVAQRLRGLLQLEYLHGIPDIFIEIISKLSPQTGKTCPCCIGSKGSIRVYTSGDTIGGDSHNVYASPQPMPTEFGGHVRNGFQAVTHKDDRDLHFWGFGIEISVPYSPEDCPCDCKFTQFVKPPPDASSGTRSGRVVDDVTGWPDPNYDESARDRWKPICKDGRLYVGDFISQNIAGDFFFRTMFFSSGTNCDRNWCSIDWMISVRRTVDREGRTTGFEFGGFWELARNEG